MTTATKLTEKDITLPDDNNKWIATVLGDRIVFVRFGYDDSPENPLEEWDGMGTIYSLNRRHRNFDVDAVENAVKTDRDVVLLSYFEHGLCKWFVQGEQVTGVEFQWDGVRFAGVWVPDDTTRAAAPKGVRGKRLAARRAWLEERATGICETYTEWCNGHVFGYEVEVYTLLRDPNTKEPWADHEDYRRQTALWEDSCWGIYDLPDGYLKQAAVENLLPYLNTDSE